MSNFLEGLKDAQNYTLTENGATTHITTKSNLLDLFAMGGAMRKRSEEDKILMFRKAFEENPLYALKCLFYLRDIRGGQGEREFFKVCLHDLALTNPNVVKANLTLVPEFGRYDDWYCLVDTPIEQDMLEAIENQLAVDVKCKTPSLLAKWLKSENASSPKTRLLASKTRQFLGMTHKQYRKTLSILRNRINVLETLMSANRWDEIEFDKIPSKAGLTYRNAFARRDIIKAKYEAFARDKNAKVNAGTLYPYECVAKALDMIGSGGWNEVPLQDTNRLMVNKYWDNLTDYFNGANFNGLAIVDTSGSMWGTPMNVAISLGLYCAEKSKGPFANHFLTFSSDPKLVETEGVDFYDKVKRMRSAEWGGSTNIEAAFDLLLDTAIMNGCSQDDLPQNLIVISDMEFNECVTSGKATKDRWWGGYCDTPDETLFETMSHKWENLGFTMPHLIFWNVDARQNNIPLIGNGSVSYVSGFSPVIFETIMSGKTGYDLMMEKLNSDRYGDIVLEA